MDGFRFGILLNVTSFVISMLSLNRSVVSSRGKRTRKTSNKTVTGNFFYIPRAVFQPKTFASGVRYWDCITQDHSTVEAAPLDGVGAIVVWNNVLLDMREDTGCVLIRNKISCIHVVQRVFSDMHGTTSRICYMQHLLIALLQLFRVRVLLPIVKITFSRIIKVYLTFSHTQEKC